jgi:hypothetical protein
MLAAFLIVLPKLTRSGVAPAARHSSISSQLAASKLAPSATSRSSIGRAGLAFRA